MIAAYSGQTAVVELLLSSGANIEAANKVIIFLPLRRLSGQNNYNISYVQIINRRIIIIKLNEFQKFKK